MTRATTPILTFKFDEDLSECDNVLLTFAQRGEVVLDKRKDEMEFGTVESGGATKYTVTVTMTQYETRMFTAGIDAEVQFRVEKDGVVRATDVKSISVRRVLNDEVLQ